MVNEWVTRVLGDEYQIVIFLACNTETKGADAAFKIGIHPGLRDVEQETFDWILEGLEEGVQKLRTTPLDDLVVFYRDEV